MALNKVMIIGVAGKTPEIREVSGAKYASFSVAVSERYKNRDGDVTETTEWITISAWRGAAEIAERFVQKGATIYVEGKWHNRKWTDKNGQEHSVTEVIAETIQRLSQRQDNQDTQF